MNSSLNRPIQCTRCRHHHTELQRTQKPLKTSGSIAMSQSVCPRCGCTSFYELHTQVAWCWASGLIEIGDELPADLPGGGGAIVIARGPKACLKAQLAVMARCGRGASAGQLLVPGVPEAETEQAKGDALANWLQLCNKRQPRDGVEFAAAPIEMITDPAAIEAAFAADFEREGGHGR